MSLDSPKHEKDLVIHLTNWETFTIPLTQEESYNFDLTDIFDDTHIVFDNLKLTDIKYSFNTENIFYISIHTCSQKTNLSE